MRLRLISGSEATRSLGVTPVAIVTAMELIAEALKIRASHDRCDPVVELVVPIYNEQATLEASIRRVHAFATAELWMPWRITIADNASTDSSPEIARRLARELTAVSHLRLERKGRGLALREAWSTSPAAVVVYMDVDLSTDLTALAPLLAPLLSGHSALAVGSRLARGATVVRGPRRELISRCYNLILRAALRARFSDAQCGFKAIRTDVAAQLLPLVTDDSWFFDTELLVLAERAGLRIYEVPVDWVDDPDSKVHIVDTALADLRGVARMRRQLKRRRLVRRLAAVAAVPLAPIPLDPISLAPIPLSRNRLSPTSITRAA
jgi:glycosyltransferase involved in cell wall biosynthesis